MPPARPRSAAAVLLTPSTALTALRPSKPRASLYRVARRSTLRASDADRDGVIDRLREAAGEGRLAAHELEQRIADALRARTYGDLDATVSDLPSAQRRPDRRRVPARRAVALVRAHPALLLLAIPVAMVMVAVMIAMAVVAVSVTIIALALGHRRAMRHRIGPWRYGPPSGRRHGYRM